MSLLSIRTRPASLLCLALPALALACGDASGGDGGDENDDGPTTDAGTLDGTGDADESGESDAGTTTETGQDDDGDDTTTTTTTTTTTAGDGPKFDLGSLPDDGSGGCGGGAADDATLTGTVFAPNGTIPVTGALVYTTNTPPEGIPDGVYCAECVELDCGVDFVETNIDGSFELPTNSGDGKYLVVQKGQFMRIEPIDIAPGPTQLPDASVELPGEWNPAEGLYIPRIAVADGGYDRIEDALGKMGLGDTSIANFEETTIPGTESFELYDNGRDPASDGFVSQGNMSSLVSDPDKLAKYHIIFVPCSYDTYSDSLTPQQIDNIRSWVEAGGRWYVADWSNEWMSKVFPEYQNFYDDGFGADVGVYDSLADILDDGLLAWLEALPDPLKDINPLNDEYHPDLYDLPQVETVDNWSAIEYPLPEILVDDGMGGQVNVGHRAWLEGPGLGLGIHPLTVTGQYGCGKVQFTSYHTAEFFDYVGLSPQELVLMYTILEIGVCQADLPPPEG